jgi:hypothetical protein
MPKRFYANIERTNKEIASKMSGKTELLELWIDTGGFVILRGVVFDPANVFNTAET